MGDREGTKGVVVVVVPLCLSCGLDAEMGTDLHYLEVRMLVRW